jgi:hypothetical protein
VESQGDSGKRRLCEERIVHCPAGSGREALTLAKQKGALAEHHYPNSDGNTVFFEFVGVVELIHLGIECEEDEVWYEISERLLPMERKDRLVPPEEELQAIRNDE